MRLLLTGANGFLGKHVVRLLSSGLNKNDVLLTPKSSELNLTSFDSTMAYFDRERPDAVAHLAALCGGIGFNKNYPADVLEGNLKMGITLFEAIRKYEPEYVYTMGSVCAYPRDCQAPFKEDDLWSGYPEKTNAGYGFSKLALLMLQQEYRAQYGLKGAHWVMVNLYGPGDDFSLEDSHVIPALINKFDAAVQNNSNVVKCWGTGEATREFLYVEDAAEAIVKTILEKIDYDKPVNLGTGKDIPIKKLAHLIGDLVGFKGEIVFTGEVSDGQPKRQLDITRAQEVLGWTARTSLMKGLVNTITWYQQSRVK